MLQVATRIVRIPSCGSRNMRERRTRWRQLVRPLSPYKDESVAGACSGEPGVAETLDTCGIEDAGLFDGIEPLQCGGGVQCRILVRVHHRQQLHSPLNIRECPAPEFRVRCLVCPLGEPLFIYACLHPTHLADG